MSTRSNRPAVIRLASEADAAAIAAIYRPFVESAPTSFEFEPPPAAEMRRRIDDMLRSYPWLVCEIDGSAAGYAYASKHSARAAYQWSVDVSVYIESRYHRMGLGRALYTSLFAILIGQRFVNAYAGVTLPNPQSVGLHEAMGFTPVGVYHGVGFKHGAWHDVGWWERQLQAPPAAPAPPLPLESVRGAPEFGAWLARGLPFIRNSAQTI
jgi:phosphinothricin acetyltransferase